jgi:hypothetical protein
MAKNKGTHGKGKSTADEPDEFVQRVSSLSDTLQPHIKKIVMVACVGIAALGAWEFMKWRHDNKAQSATTAYVSAIKIVEAQIVAEGEPDPAEDSPVPVLTYKTEEERRNAGLQALSGVSSKHSGIKLSKLTGPREAKLLLLAGKFDEALAAYQKFATSDAPEPMRMVALEGVGYSLEAKAMSNEDPAARQAGLEAALRAFTELQPSDGGPMRDYSLYHQGRTLVALGKPDEGIAKYQQLLTELPDSELTAVVEGRLESLTGGE